MYLKSLELTGFKSFAEAKIEFPQGVTAIVGPNGSGKSNVVDAILWVLGEQSTKTLRSERMEDVIFNGTEARKPLGMAEVSLVMSGLDQQRLAGLPPLPVPLEDYHEVMITRRLYRNGDSEYLINKTPCRLKDVRSLFLDTRAGSKGHTIIEQNRIEQILNASPQERRELIEETAGIVRYKKQKAEALRKLDATHQNLLRVRDIIAEVQRQLGSLERQARQARAYQNLQQEAKALEVRLLAREGRALRQSQAEIEGQLDELDVRESGQMAEQARLTGQLEELKLGMAEAEQSLGGVRDELARVERERAQALTAAEVERGRLDLYGRQRAQAGEELARLQAEGEQVTAAMAELRQRLAQAETDLQERARILSDLEAGVAALTARRTSTAEAAEQARRESLDLTVRATREENAIAGLEHRRQEALRRAERLALEQAEIESQHRTLSQAWNETVRRREEGEGRLQEKRREQAACEQEALRLEDQLRDLDHRIGRKQEELAALESRLQALQGVAREEMGYGRTGEEPATSLRGACVGVRDAVAEWLAVPAGYERAIEAALGEKVRAWLVDGAAPAREAIAFLKQKDLGRGTFVPLRPRWTGDAQAETEPSWWPGIKGERGVKGRALDLVQANGVSREVLACLFEQVIVVESLDVALGLWERGLWSAPHGPLLVTMDGDLLDAAGVITGGSSGATAGLLQRRREIRTLEAQLEEFRLALDAGRKERELAAASAAACKTTLQGLDEAIREAEGLVLAVSKEEARLGLNVSELGRRVETVQTERRMTEEEREAVETESREGAARLARLTAERTEREGTLAELGRALAAMEEESRARQQQVMEARLAIAECRSRKEHGETDLVRLAREQEERKARAEGLERQIGELGEAERRSEAERVRNEAKVRELESHVDLVRARMIAAQEALAQDAERAGALDRQLAAAREALSASRDARTAVEVRRAEVKTQLATVESTLTGTYQLSLDRALEQEAGEQVELAEAADSGEGTAPVQVEEALRERLKKVRERLERMGPINLAAIEEHRELEERHRFLTAQEQDLTLSVSSLKEIIAKINRTTKQMFVETFNELQEKFGEVFARFFPGGRAELVLTEPEANPESDQKGSEEPGVDIVAQPPGKRLKSITMLSGGEKTLTAMALIFASFLIRPTPFCVLDEIDAPLDEENIGRFTGVLKELAEDAQFMVITHNKRTMTIADSLFGVTMEEPGISKLVSVRLADLQPA
ncbi:MAG: chromosome segregation protein SMC [Nitrospirota bacterium]